MATALIDNKIIEIKNENLIKSFLVELIKDQALSENQIFSEIRKKNGIFFTGRYCVVEKIVELIAIDRNLLQKKILEPACGHGIFLLVLIEKAYLKFPQKGFIYNLINDCLIFNDIDPLMVEKTKENVKKIFRFLFEEEYVGAFNAYVIDFTHKEGIKSKLFNYDSFYPFKNLLNCVDYVIGNPPYVTLYGRRDKKKNEEQRIKILENYNQFPPSVKNGKINYVMLFLEHTLDLMAPNAKLGFIIDISFFETAYKYTRKFLLENSQIISLDINLTSFDVGSGQLILKLKKSFSNKNALVEIYDSRSNETNRIRQLDWYKPEDEYKFRLKACSATEKIIQKFDRSGLKSLKEQFPDKNLRTCTMLLDMEDRFTNSNSHYFDGCQVYPYYQGSKSLKAKFSSLTSEKYFFYNKKLQDQINEELKKYLERKGVKNKKRIGFGEVAVYDNPKVYIRQSAKEIIATYDEVKSSANNSLYIFSLRVNGSEARRYLKFLCGFLNCDLVTFYCQKRNIIRFIKGKQPQIKISDLYSIRVPKDEIFINSVFGIVSEIYSGNKGCEEKIRELNSIIFDYYQIERLEQKFIEKSIKSF